MFILLPPSEAKNGGGDGLPLTAVGFGRGPVARHRARLCAAVERAAARTRRTAMTAFVLPEAVADAAITANAVVTTSPTRPTLDRYAGVLYTGLAVATMTAVQRQVADEQVFVFSGLFGALAGHEAVPDYRVPAATVLPRIGVLGSSWRPLLTTALPARLSPDRDATLIVDLRSSDYAAMWRPPRDLPVTAVRIVTEMPDGQRKVVSYGSKLAKGRLARALIERSAAGEPARTPADVVRTWVETGLGLPAPGTTAANPARLDLLTAPA